MCVTLTAGECSRDPVLSRILSPHTPHEPGGGLTQGPLWNHGALILTQQEGSRCPPLNHSLRAHFQVIPSHYSHQVISHLWINVPSSFKKGKGEKALEEVLCWPGREAPHPPSAGAWGLEPWGGILGQARLHAGPEASGLPSHVRGFLGRKRRDLHKVRSIHAKCVKLQIGMSGPSSVMFLRCMFAFLSEVTTGTDSTDIWPRTLSLTRHLST